MYNFKNTVSPLPSYKDFFSEKKTENTLLEPWCNPGEKAWFFSRSCWSFVAIIEWYKLFYNKKKVSILLPAYFCSEVVVFLNQFAEIIFYPIFEDFSLIFDKTEVIINESKPNFFLLVNYFGNFFEYSSLKKACKENNVFIIEDCTHCFLPSRKKNSLADFLVYSLYKHLPVPDGSVCVMSSKLLKSINKKLAVSSMQKVQENLPGRKNKYVKIWVFKKFLQRALSNKLLKKKLRSLSTLPKNKDSYFMDLWYCELSRMSSLSMKILSARIKTLNKIKNERIASYHLWKYIISFYCPDIRILDINIKEGCPYWLVCAAKTYENAKEIINIIKKLGVTLLRWPDLPLSMMSSNASFLESALSLQKRLIFFPVHYFPSVELIKNVIESEYKNLKYCFDLNEINDLAEWEKYSCEFGIDNPMQTWSYGEAKKNNNKLGVKRFIVFENKNPVAIFQVLIKKVFGKLVFRINRGPIFCHDYNEFQRLRVYYFLCNKSTFFKNKVVIWAPNEFDSPFFNFLFKEILKLRKLKSGFSSILLPLACSLDEIRAKLNGKWRNQLVQSEGKGIQFLCSSDFKYFDWIVKKHINSQKVNDYSALSEAFLNEWYLVSKDKNSFLLGLAFYEDKIVSGLIFSLNSKGCYTYLIGWIDDLGRSLNANNFLMWNMISHLKNEAARELDLGGISVSNKKLLDITKFKTGIGGESYSLVGEFLCW